MQKNCSKTINTLFRYFIVIPITLFLFSCKNEQNLFTQKPKIPEAYDIKQEGNFAGKFKWKEFYNDSLLNQLIDTALKSNNSIKIAQQRIEQYKSSVVYRRGAMLPSAGLAAVTGQRRFGKYTMDGVGNFDTNFSPNIEEAQRVPEHLPEYLLGLSVSWEIDLFGKLNNKRKSAIASVFAAKEERNFLITQIIAEIAENYYDLVALDYELDILNQSIVLQQNAIQIIKLQKEAGETNELAVKQFEAQLYYFNSLKFEILNKIIEKENAINLLLGKYPQPIKRNSKLFDVLPNPLNAGIPADLLLNRPDIRKSEFELVAAKADVNAARSSFLPNLSLNSMLGFQSFNSAFLFNYPASLAYSVMGSILAPVINLSAIKAEFKRAKSYQVEAYYNYFQTILNGYVEVNTLLQFNTNLQKFHENKQLETEALRSAVDNSSQLFFTGRASYLEIIISRKNYLQSQIELIDAKRNLYKNNLRVYKSLGGGWQ